jgi:hypothetical protein
MKSDLSKIFHQWPNSGLGYGGVSDLHCISLWVILNLGKLLSGGSPPSRFYHSFHLFSFFPSTLFSHIFSLEIQSLSFFIIYGWSEIQNAAPSPHLPLRSNHARSSDSRTTSPSTSQHECESGCNHRYNLYRQINVPSPSIPQPTL